MSLQRTIVQKLFESKGLNEASFESGGSTYSCAFGRYSKDGESITRDEYFKAKESASSSSSSSPKSNDDSSDPKDWSDSRVLSYEEAQKFAMANYDKGGDSFVESWADYQFDDYVKQFGPMTVKDMKSMFKTDNEVSKDMEGSGQSQDDDTPASPYGRVGESLSRLPKSTTKKYKDGNVTSFEYDEDLIDYLVEEIPENFRSVQEKNTSKGSTQVYADDNGNTIWINSSPEGCKVWCYNEPKHAQKKIEEPKVVENPDSIDNADSYYSYKPEGVDGGNVDTKKLLNDLKDRGYKLVRAQSKDANGNRQGHDFVFSNGKNYVRFYRKGGRPSEYDKVKVSNKMPPALKFDYNSNAEISDYLTGHGEQKGMYHDLKNYGFLSGESREDTNPKDSAINSDPPKKPITKTSIDSKIKHAVSQHQPLKRKPTTINKTKNALDMSSDAIDKYARDEETVASVTGGRQVILDLGASDVNNEELANALRKSGFKQASRSRYIAQI